nr:hypothetical protein [uncultured Acetatifactor sp.]
MLFSKILKRDIEGFILYTFILCRNISLIIIDNKVFLLILQYQDCPIFLLIFCGILPNENGWAKVQKAAAHLKQHEATAFRRMIVWIV